MIRQSVIIEDIDMQIDAFLEVRCSKLPGETQGPRDWKCAGTPAIADALEVDCVALHSLVLWVGSEPCVLRPISSEDGLRIAQWMRDNKHGQIVAKLKEKTNE